MILFFTIYHQGMIYKCYKCFFCNYFRLFQIGFFPAKAPFANRLGLKTAINQQVSTDVAIL